MHGVVVIDKPIGVTSNDVVQRVKRLFFANKVGHTGSLDPLATGVLPICLGEATKFSQFLLDSDKAYISEFVLGETTDTCDSDGRVIEVRDASHIDEAAVRSTLSRFTGEIEQVPPMYSAIKQNGQPLYKLAREGIEVERQARKVSIYEIELQSFEVGARAKVKVFVRCSKGTYVRSLADDIGRELGVGGHVASLRRIQAGQFDLSRSQTLEALESERGEEKALVLDHHLLPVDSPVAVLPEINLETDSAFYFSKGQAVASTESFALGDEGDKVRVFDHGGQFLGVGELTGDGMVAPKRLVVYQ